MFIKKKLLILIILMLFQTSCMVTYYRSKKSTNIDSNSKIAVMAGMFDYSTINFAEYLTEEFHKQTKFSVISQNRFKKSNKYYPVRVKGPYSSSFFEIEDDYTLTDKQKILKYARSVKSDYVYVIWVPVVYSVNNNVHECSAIGQMFNTQTGEEIGYGKYPMFWFKGSYIGWGAARTQEEALKRGAAAAVKDISTKMGMTK